MTSPAADFSLTNHGTIFTIEPVTQQAKDWFDENVPTEGWQWMGSACSVEPRCIEPLVEGILEEGMTIQ
jgi:hypothetical protein